MRPFWRPIHQYAGLTFVLPWVLQAVIGVTLELHGEIDPPLWHGRRKRRTLNIPQLT